MRHFTTIVLLVLTANVLVGLLGIQLAIPPGYATAIWPPSGVALASVLIWRTPGLVGVWFASFFINTINQYSFQIPSIEALIAPAWIASASSLQAMLGAFLVRRYVGYPTRLNRSADILRFLILAGPMSCLVSATLSVGFLVATGTIEAESAEINWLTWWVGDTIGVTAFAPLMFLMFALPRHHWKTRRFAVGLPLALVVIFTILMYRQALDKEEESQSIRFKAQASALQLAIQAELDAHISQLYNLRGFLYSNFDLSPLDFKRFSKEILRRQASLQGLSWNVYLQDHERKSFEDKMRKAYNGVPFILQERDLIYGFVPSKRRDNYVAITLVEPFDLHQTALGFDVLSSPPHRQALEQAVKTGQASATTPIRLAQEFGEQRGVFIFLPSFHSKSTPEQEGERLDALAGYVSAVVRIDDLISNVLTRYHLKKSGLRLYPKSHPNQFYYTTSQFDFNEKSMLYDQSEINVGSDVWILEQSASKQNLAYSWGLYFVLISGFSMTSLMGGFLLVLAGRTSDISRQVRLRTKELQKSNELLAESQRIAQMGSWEWAHDGLDHQWSAQFYNLLDLDPEENKADEHLFLEQLSPDQVPEVKRALVSAIRGQRLDIECCLREQSDRPQRHLALKGERVIVNHRNGDQKHFLSIVARDITEQQYAAQELELAAITFETHEAIVITDTETVVQRVNKAFTRITGYSSDEVLGKKINFLKSGRHGDNFYRELWQSLGLKGHWHGEIWNKRKDGVVFPELVTITAVDTLGHGQPTHYVAAFLDITEKKASEERIRYLAYYDSITQLPNRDLFMESLRHQLAHCERHNGYTALLFMDLDNFKMLNDSLGHDIGDELLKRVAERLTDVLRAEDIFSRFGGDEFLFLLPANLDSPEQVMDQAAHVADRILMALEEPFDLKGHNHKVSASIGVTYLPQPDVEAEGYIQQADTAMYRAKNAGKAAFAFYEPQMQMEILNRLELEKSIRVALEQDQFVLFYQPQHDQHGAMVGCEALVRWNHPEKGIVGPINFIDVAEESSLIIDLGLQVLEKACHQMQLWQDTSMGDCEVSINISSRHFAHPAFIQHIESALERYPAIKGKLWLEITEGVFLKSGANLDETFKQLKRMQMRCSIDDFGTGYSSLGYLKNLDIDQLKIAQEFVRDLVKDKKDAQLVKAIVQMGISLGIHLVAEGVETQDQYDFLQELGCPCYQGYLFARPMPADELLDYQQKLLLERS